MGGWLQNLSRPSSGLFTSIFRTLPRESLPRLSAWTKFVVALSIYRFAIVSATKHVVAFSKQDARWGDKLCCKFNYTAEFDVHQGIDA